MPPVPGLAMMNRVIDRVWERGQSAKTETDKELVSITLRFLRTLDLDRAAVLAVGCPFEKWRLKAAARKENLDAQFRQVSSSRATENLVALAKRKGANAGPTSPKIELPPPVHIEVGDRNPNPHRQDSDAVM